MTGLPHLPDGVGMRRGVAAGGRGQWTGSLCGVDRPHKPHRFGLTLSTWESRWAWRQRPTGALKLWPFVWRGTWFGARSLLAAWALTAWVSVAVRSPLPRPERGPDAAGGGTRGWQWGVKAGVGSRPRTEPKSEPLGATWGLCLGRRMSSDRTPVTASAENRGQACWGLPRGALGSRQ